MRRQVSVFCRGFPIFVGFYSVINRNARWLRQVTAYVFVGGLTFAIDFGTLMFLSKLHVLWQLAVTVAYALALSVHFTLNRLNFGTFQRPLQNQLTRYGVVAVFQYAQTLLVIGVARHFGLSTIEGKVIAVAVGLPAGFLGLKYLAFGAGFSSATHRSSNQTTRTEQQGPSHPQDGP